MRKTVKKLFLVTLSLLMCLASIPVYAASAENQVMPRLSHMDDASFVFDASSSGGIIEATYTAILTLISRSRAKPTELLRVYSVSIPRIQSSTIKKILPKFYQNSKILLTNSIVHGRIIKKGGRIL